jgi:adenine/guanine phosphoribosyltransferase-like PRPP-binding protein
MNEEYRDVVGQFFEENPTIRHTISLEPPNLLVEVDGSGLAGSVMRQIALYLKYLDLFEWREGGVENVVFWERPERFDALVDDFQVLMEDLVFDVIAPLEARGFLLAGLIAKEIHTPIMPIRKFKPFFERFPGTKVDFTNWKGEGESLFLFERDLFDGQRVLVVDDLIETGNSLEASLEALHALRTTPMGAFYLCDVMDEERRRDFSIPIRSFVKRGGIL